MTAPAAIVRLDVRLFATLDRKVDQAEGEGIHARWEFGRELLKRRVGKQLPKGLLAEITAETGKTERELQRRMRLAERFPTAQEVRHAVTDFDSWHRIVNEALAEEQEQDAMAVHYSSVTDEWATPQTLFDLLDSEFHFELDVCALDSSAKCDRYFDPETDGLAQAWRGSCFMNPPYGDVIGKWVRKAWESAQDGATVVCLLPARVDTAWWWDYCRHGEIRFLRGRLKFGNAETSAPFPSAVVVFAPDRKAQTVWWERG